MANKLADLFVEVRADGRRMRRDLDVQRNHLQSFARTATGILASIGVGVSVAGILRLGKSFVMAAADAEESENLFDVTMGRMSDSVRKWSDDTSRQLRLNSYEVRKMVSTFHTMLKAMGVTEDQAASMSAQLTELAYDISSFRNISTEEAFGKIQSAMVGMSRPMQDLGYVINETSVRQRALTNGIISQDRELTTLEKVYGRFAEMMVVTKEAQGDLSRTMNSTTNQIRGMKSAWQEFRVEVGKGIKTDVGMLAGAGGAAMRSTFGKSFAGGFGRGLSEALYTQMFGPIAGKLVRDTGRVASDAAQAASVKGAAGDSEQAKQAGIVKGDVSAGVRGKLLSGSELGMTESSALGGLRGGGVAGMVGGFGGGSITLGKATEPTRDLQQMQLQTLAEIAANTKQMRTVLN